MAKSAVVAGHICLDMIPQVDHHFDLVPGRLYEVGAPTMATGGAVSNTGMTMHILGTPVTLMGKIGADSFGDIVLNVIAKRAPGLEKGMTIDKGSVTSYTTVINIPGIDRIFLHCPGANSTYVSADVKWDAVAKADLFHFGYPCFMAGTYAEGGKELKAMYAKAKELGVTTSMDPGMPDANGPAGKVNWKQLLKELLPNLDVFMPSADELLYMICPERFGQGDNLTTADLKFLSDELLGMGAAVAAVKMGSRGMFIGTASKERLAAMGRGKPEDLDDWANRQMVFPCYKPTKFMGATGAGDSSIGGFLSAMLRGLKFEDAGLFAAAVGASNVEAADSLSGIRDWGTTMARINAGWQTTPTDLGDASWKLDERNVWHGPQDGVSR